MIDRVSRIAKRVVARSQMVKKCRILSGNIVEGVITEEIFDGDRKNLEKIRYGFLEEVDRELSDIGIQTVKKGVEMSLDNNMIVFTYKFRQRISDEQKELVMQHEWIVDNRE